VGGAAVVDVSYDLRVFGADPVALGGSGSGEEFEIVSGELVASVVVAPGELGLGVYADDEASSAARARDFEALLRRLLGVGRVHDPQLGRDIASSSDVDEAVRFFAQT
jgi:hypothetical protein